VPQQSAFSSGAQQVACAAGAEHGLAVVAVLIGCTVSLSVRTSAPLSGTSSSVAPAAGAARAGAQQARVSVALAGAQQPPPAARVARTHARLRQHQLDIAGALLTPARADDMQEVFGSSFYIEDCRYNNQ
jgi:hypothetical protein